MSVVPMAGETFRSEDGTVSTVLPENADPHYEPPEEELEEYAEFLGIDVANEPALLWIAMEGLRTPLPDEWRACQTNDDEIYYFNFKTGESLWDHPMDDVFKEKVVRERAKLSQAGGSGKERESGKATPNTSMNASLGSQPGKGSIKAIANSLLGGVKTGPASTGAAKLAPPALSPGRLGSLELPSPLAGRGPLPDVADIPPRAAASSLTMEGSKSLPLGGRMPPPALHALGSGRAGPTAVPASAKDIEASIRRRVEEEYVPLRRAMAIELDKKEITERHRLEEALKKYKIEVAAEVANSSASDAPKRGAEIQQEVKGIEDKWASRFQRLTSAVMNLHNELGKKKEALHTASRAEPIAALKKRLSDENAAAAEQRRQELKNAKDEELFSMLRDQSNALAELATRDDADLTTARTRMEAENKKRLDFQASQSKNMIGALERQVQEKKDLLATTNASKGPASATTGAHDDEKMIHEATAKSAAEIEKLTSECAAALDTLTREYEDKLQRLRGQLHHKNATSAASPLLTVSVSISNQSVLTEEQLAQLKDEEDAMQKTMEGELKAFLLETEAMVKERGESASSWSTAASFEGSVDTPLRATPGIMTDTQEARAKEAEVARHLAALQQLELKHDKAIRLIKESHERELQKRKTFDPRKAPPYAKRIAQAKKDWLLAHPPPIQQMPVLDPVPRFNPTMADMPEVKPPEEAAVKAHLAKALADIRSSMAAEQQSKLAAMEAAQAATLASLKRDYHAQRLAAVTAALTAYKQSLEDGVTAEQMKMEGVVAEAAHQQNVALTKTIEDLQTAVKSAEANHAEEMDALRQRVVELDSAITSVRAAAEAASIPPPPPAVLANGTSPIPSLDPIEEEEEDVVVTQPDYVSYISMEDAERLEESLHAKWRSTLDGLRTHLQDELHHRTVSAAGVHASKDNDVSVTAPPLDVSMTVAGAANGRHVSERPPLATMPIPQSPLVPPSLCHHQDLSDPANTLNDPQSLSASSIRAVPRQQFWEPSSNGARLTSLTSHSGVHMATFPSPLTTAPHPSQGPLPAAQLNSANVLRQHDVEAAAYSTRLLEIHSALKKYKRSLCERQQRLLALRSEWRADMRRCRETKSRAAAVALRHVKSELEEEAQSLNAAVLNLKDTGQRLRVEEARLVLDCPQLARFVDQRRQHCRPARRFPAAQDAHEAMIGSLRDPLTDVGPLPAEGRSNDTASRVELPAREDMERIRRDWPEKDIIEQWLSGLRLDRDRRSVRT